MKFSTKIAALFLISLLVIFAISGYLGYTSSIGLLENQIRGELEDHAFHTMDKIDRMLFERYLDMSFLATDPLISSRRSTPEQITEKLVHYQRKYKHYSSLSFFDLKRKRIVDTLGENIGERHPLTKYWPSITAGRDFVMVIAESQAAKKATVYFASVVKDKKGNPFGVIVSWMPVENLYEIAEQTFVLKNKQIPKISLLDKEGLVLYSSYNIRGMLKDKSDDWDYIRGLISADKSVGSARHSYPEGEEITAFARERGHLDFKGNGWILVICTPADVALAPVAKQHKMFMIVFSIIGLLGLLSSFLFTRTITRPLKELSRAAIEIGRGNLDTNVGITSRDEIGQLARAFNKMASDLKESETKYRGLAELLPQIVYEIDEKGNIVFANRHGLKIFGLTNDDFQKGLNVFQLIIPEDHDRLKENMQKVLRGEIVEGLGFTALRKDGSEFPVLTFTAPILHENKAIGLRGLAIDITEHKQAEEALHKNEKKIRDITSSLGEGLYVLNKKGNLTFINREAERLLGWTENDLINKNVHDTIHCRKPDGTPLSFEQCPLHAVSRSGTSYASRNEVFTRKDGTVFPVSVICTPVIENDEIIATVTAFRDITERKKIEAERERLVLQLQDALDKVKTLRGFIPICASCKRVRDDKGYWNQVEAYVSEHSLAEFSHSICPECMKKIYPEYHEGKDA